MHKILRFFILSVLFTSCVSKENNTTTYFGGAIINPTSNSIRLYKDEKLIDSVRLGQDNTFLFQLQDIQDGIYHFNHDPQYQYVYLKSGDSLMARLNTIEFDESLVFSGDSDILNNYLLQMFLQTEKENHLIKSWYPQPAEVFLKRVDSLTQIKYAFLQELLQENQFTTREKQLMDIATNYHTYYHKEYYPYMHQKKTNAKDFPKLPAHFYNHRKHIGFHWEEMAYFKPYYDYMGSFFFNKTLTGCIIPCGFNYHSHQDQLHYHLHKLKIIDSLAHNKTVANLFTHKTTKEYFFKGNTPKNNEIFFKNFKAFNDDESHRKEILEIYHNLQSLQSGKPIPNLKVLDSLQESKQLFSLSKNSPTVYYFWSTRYSAHTKRAVRIIRSLKTKYPNYQFIGICLNSPFMDWKIHVSTALFRNTKQYFCEDFDLFINKLMISHKNKIIITDKDGNIVDAFSNLKSDRLRLVLDHVEQ
ncbi:MAG: hypothetical protein OIF50_05330 [Flavobacteriaceae bacterium]|nr:hypothetical protein [Flavobacteriaceae bacterium]